MTDATTLRATPEAQAALARSLAQSQSLAKPQPQSGHQSGQLRLSAKSIKITIVLDPNQLADFAVPNGAARIPFAIACAGRTITGQFNAKSLRRAITTITENGADQTTVVIQGRLTAANVVEDAGLACQIKGPKPEPQGVQS
jgi:hypothetical protein